MTELHTNWDQTNRRLTSTGQVGIAVVAAAIAIVTGGIGTGIAGAMLTAASTTATTTATISATNASMNGDGSFIGSLDDTTKTALKDTTSKESVKNIAISAAVTGAASWAISSANGNPDLKTGSYEGSKVGVNVEKSPVDGKWVFEGTKKEATQFDTYVFGNENPVFKGANASIPSVNSGAAGHDAWILDMEKSGVLTSGTNTTRAITAITAPPYLLLNACAAAPSACGLYVNNKLDNKFLNQKP